MPSEVSRRRRAAVDAVTRGALENPGVTSPALRKAASRGEDVPAELATYVDKMARHAYKITDEDLAALAAAGHDDDAIFEISLAVAVGAGMRRIDAGMAALDALDARDEAAGDEAAGAGDEREAG